jgi:hypothetical protein
MKTIFHAVKIFLLVLTSWLLSASFLLAKEGTAPTTSTESSEKGSWVFSYFLTGLAVVWGLLVVCRASNRRDRVRPEGYVEGKVGHANEEK